MINRKARLWIGLTLFIVLFFNYAVVGFPLYRKAASLHDKATVMMMKQIKAGNVLKGGEEEYILEIFRREKSAIDNKILILNIVAVSLIIIIASWTVFGLIFQKQR